MARAESGRAPDVQTALGPIVDVPEPDPAVVELLGMARRHLGMDLAWMSQLVNGDVVLQVLDGDASTFGMKPGSTIRGRGSYFPRILSGELPCVMADCREDPRTARLPVTAEFGLGSYAAVPVVDRDGQPYGLLGCLCHEPRPLSARDGLFLRLLADVLTDHVSDLRQMWERRTAIWNRVSKLIDAGGPDMAFQPMFRLADRVVIGYEALSRFPPGTGNAVRWFAEAAGVGLGGDLELAAIRRALAALPDIPPGLLLSVNASPATIDAELIEMLTRTDPERLLVEITEHERIEDSPMALHGIAILRERGARIAADDVGSGYAGLEQLVHLRPEVIKMDQRLTRGIDADPARRAVAAALVRVTDDIGGCVLAEGIETPAELDTVTTIGVHQGQGHTLAAPGPLRQLTRRYTPTAPVAAPAVSRRPGAR